VDQKKLLVIFGTFRRYVPNLRGTFVENKKRDQNQPTLQFSQEFSAKISFVNIS
jgi:hypothetical protein